jgi:hypothetical protein
MKVAGTPFGMETGHATANLEENAEGLAGRNPFESGETSALGHCTLTSWIRVWGQRDLREGDASRDQAFAHSHLDLVRRMHYSDTDCGSQAPVHVGTHPNRPCPD